MQEGGAPGYGSPMKLVLASVTLMVAALGCGSGSGTTGDPDGGDSRVAVIDAGVCPSSTPEEDGLCPLPHNRICVYRDPDVGCFCGLTPGNSQRWTCRAKPALCPPAPPPAEEACPGPRMALTTCLYEPFRSCVCDGFFDPPRWRCRDIHD